MQVDGTSWLVLPPVPQFVYLYQVILTILQGHLLPWLSTNTPLCSFPSHWKQQTQCKWQLQILQDLSCWALLDQSTTELRDFKINLSSSVTSIYKLPYPMCVPKLNWIKSTYIFLSILLQVQIMTHFLRKIRDTDTEQEETRTRASAPPLNLYQRQRVELVYNNANCFTFFKIN